MNLFFLVLARDGLFVNEKLNELRKLKEPHLIVCGERLNLPQTAYCEPKGKYDAINFGAKHIPENIDVVALNDVDTKIHNMEAAKHNLLFEDADLVFASVFVRKGPQRSFYSLLDFLRRKIPIAASGELMLIKREVFSNLLPLEPCKAEDTYILFKVLEQGGKVIFCEECVVETERTVHVEREEAYKRRTVCGIYQALSKTRPPFAVRFFYSLLPLVSPLLLILGRKGYYWMRGILLGLTDFLRGEQSGSWQPTSAHR